jgi:hypothetical protein
MAESPSKSGVFPWVSEEGWCKKPRPGPGQYARPAKGYRFPYYHGQVLTIRPPTVLQAIGNSVFFARKMLQNPDFGAMPKARNRFEGIA